MIKTNFGILFSVIFSQPESNIEKTQTNFSDYNYMALHTLPDHTHIGKKTYFFYGYQFKKKQNIKFVVSPRTVHSSMLMDHVSHRKPILCTKYQKSFLALGKRTCLSLMISEHLIYHF